jgi:two-component system, LytTR family, response regulator
MGYSTIIVDDEENARLLIRSRLEAGFPQIRVAAMCENAGEALIATLHHKPDFIMLDIQMPGMTGLELMQLLRESNARVKILIVTAYTETCYFQESIRLGVIDYLVKPFSMDDFTIAINRILHRLKEEEEVNQLDTVLNTMAGSRKVKLKAATSWLFVPVSEIIYATADGKYSEVCLKNNSTELLMYGITQLFDMLKTHTCMLKIDRSTIINKNYVKKVYLKQKKVVFAVDTREIELAVSAPGIETLLEAM